MKKISVILMVLALLLGCIGATAETFEGVGTGNGGDIKVAITVEDGKITATVTLSGKSYTWFFVGESSKIADCEDSAFIPYVENENGEFTFTFALEALDQVIPCAAYSKNKDAWYPRNILFDSDTLEAIG